MEAELKSKEELSKIHFLGRDCKIYKYAQLIKPEVILIGNGCQIDDFSWLHGGEKLCIGDRVHICAFVSISGGGKVNIGSFAGLAAGVRIISGSENPMGKGLTNPCIPDEYRSVKRSYVIVEEHALVFTSTIVYPGVTIGEGSVIMPGSVVKENLDPWGIYEGSPIKKIRNRKKERIKKMTTDMVAKYGY